jgi:hypothetical protein
LNAKRIKTCSENDIFICFTTGECEIDQDSMPGNCIVVSRETFKFYYGPFYAFVIDLVEQFKTAPEVLCRSKKRTRGKEFINP